MSTVDGHVYSHFFLYYRSLLLYRHNKAEHLLIWRYTALTHISYCKAKCIQLWFEIMGVQFILQWLMILL